MTLKRFYTLIAALIVVISAHATEDATFDFTNPEALGFTRSTEFSTGVDVPSGTALKSGKVTITVNNNAANIAKFWTGSEAKEGAVDFRVYAGATLTITADGDYIKYIAIEGAKTGSGAMDFSEGTYMSGIWGGSTTSLVITIKATVNFNSFIVTTASTAGVANPKLSPGANIFFEPQNITMTCATEGATIYYTLDGTNPTTASSIYTEPVLINKTTIIKAFAYKDGVSSDLIEAYYQINVATKVANIAEFIALGAGAVGEFTNPVYVLYQNGKYLFIKDDSGCLQVYGALNTTYKNGDIIPAGINGTVTEYTGAIQMAPNSDSFIAGISGDAIAPITKTIDEIDALSLNEYVIIKNLTVTLVSSKNYTLSDGTATLPAFARFSGITFPTDDKKYDIAGIVNSNLGTLQLFPTAFTYSSGVDNVETSTTTIVAGNGIISINAETSTEVVIINGAGQVVAQKSIIEGENNIEVATGFYIVKVANVVTKVIVKQY